MADHSDGELFHCNVELCVPWMVLSGNVEYHGESAEWPIPLWVAWFSRLQEVSLDTLVFLRVERDGLSVWIRGWRSAPNLSDKAMWVHEQVRIAISAVSPDQLSAEEQSLVLYEDMVNAKGDQDLSPEDIAWGLRPGDVAFSRLYEGYRSAGMINRKLDRQREGPVTVLEAVGKNAYRIKVPDGMNIHDVGTAHQLEPMPEERDPWRRDFPPGMADVRHRENDAPVEEAWSSQWRERHGEAYFSRQRCASRWVVEKSS